MAVSMFSKRHYEAVAEVLVEARPAAQQGTFHNDRAGWQSIRDALADLFEADNENFNRTKWEEVCER